MWRVGMNKSNLSNSRQASEDGGNKSHKSFKRFINKSQSELKPQILIRRSQSKSSIKKTSRVNSQKQSNNNSVSIEFSNKNSQCNPFDSLKAETKVSNTPNDFFFSSQSRLIDKKQNKIQDQIFNSPIRYPIMKKDSILKQIPAKVSIEIQVDLSHSDQKTTPLIQSHLQPISNNNNQQLQTIIQRQKLQIKNLKQKIQKLQQTHDLYQFKIAQLQIQFTTFRSHLSKQLTKQKQQMRKSILTIQEVLKPLETKVSQKEQFIIKTTKPQIIPSINTLSPQKYVNNILAKISQIKKQIRSSSKDNKFNEQSNIALFKNSLNRVSQLNTKTQELRRITEEDTK